MYYVYISLFLHHFVTYLKLRDPNRKHIHDTKNLIKNQEMSLNIQQQLFASIQPSQIHILINIDHIFCSPPPPSFSNSFVLSLCAVCACKMVQPFQHYPYTIHHTSIYLHVIASCLFVCMCVCHCSADLLSPTLSNTRTTHPKRTLKSYPIIFTAPGKHNDQTSFISQI